MEHQVGQQFESPPEMLFHKNRIDESLLLCGIGVQLPSHILHPIQDMPGLTLFRPLEYHVFDKVSQAKFIHFLIPCPGIHGKPALRHRGCRRKMYDTQTVR